MCMLCIIHTSITLAHEIQFGINSVEFMPIMVVCVTHQKRCNYWDKTDTSMFFTEIPRIM